jgi:hypothetical protein
MAYDDTEPVTTENILRRINQSHARLEALYEELDAEALSRPGPEGWSLKDHLAHIAAWDGSLLGLLRGGGRLAAMGLDPAAGEPELDALNETVYERYRGEPAEAVLAFARETHEQVLATVGAMSDADLMRPYSHYQPDDPPYNANPVFGWIAGNTFGHYDEHADYIEAVLASFEA